MSSLLGGRQPGITPQDTSRERAEAAEAERLRRARASGRESTILGGTTGNQLQTKRLLGE